MGFALNGAACSPYSVKDCYGMNPEFGTLEDLKAFGDGLEAAIVLSVVGDGMPLIYNGQEAGNPKRLRFFEKDPIEWREHPIGDLYQKLFALKKANTALWSGQWGTSMVRVWNTKPLSFCDAPFKGTYTEYLSGSEAQFTASTELTPAPWSYRVYLQ